MVDEVVRNVVAHRERLGALLQAVRGQALISLNLGTFWAKARHNGASPTGCLIGHYVKRAGPKHLELVPLNFLEQLKAPLLAERELAAFPNAEWRHHTLHYHGPDIEAWGLSAACLYFQLGKWDAQTLFWPSGYGNAMTVETTTVVTKLERFLSVEKTMHEDLP